MVRLRLRLATFLSAVVLLGGLAISPTEAEVPGLAFTDTGCEGYSDGVARLYTAGLGRLPEQAGFEFWLVQYTRGQKSLLDMADFFANSDEFKAVYGTLNEEQFVKQIYRNILGREGEAEGVTYWTGRLTSDLDQGGLLVLFAESTENVARSGTAEPTLGVFNTGLKKAWSCTSWTPPNPGDSKNCSDFGSRRQAQAWFDYYYPAYGDLAKLDADNNRVPCESLPGGVTIKDGVITIELSG